MYNFSFYRDETSDDAKTASIRWSRDWECVVTLDPTNAVQHFRAAVAGQTANLAVQRLQKRKYKKSSNNFCDFVHLGRTQPVLRFRYCKLKCTHGSLRLEAKPAFNKALRQLRVQSNITFIFPSKPLLNSTFYFKQPQIRDNGCFPLRVLPALCRCASFLPNWTRCDRFPPLCADGSRGALAGKCHSRVWLKLRLNGPLLPGDPLLCGAALGVAAAMDAAVGH